MTWCETACGVTLWAWAAVRTACREWWEDQWDTFWNSRGGFRHVD